MKIAAALLVAFVTVPALRAVEGQPTLPLVQTFDAAWSIIDTTYYDPTFRGLDWKAVRAELRPEAERAKTPAELRATIAKMLARLGESHFAVLPQFADDSEEDSLDRSGALHVADGGGHRDVRRTQDASHRRGQCARRQVD